jgi:Family of unknown function (DUF6282)
VFDAHVHSAPCVVPRLADDAETVRAYEAAGFSGCVLKGHREPTAGRARTASADSEVAVHGGIVLNSAVGGLNPAAVEAALALGARVWMPTLDARAHSEAGLARRFPEAPYMPSRRTSRRSRTPSGPERCILTSDSGQMESPPPPEALARLVAALEAEGLDERRVAAMASTIPEALVSP